VFVSSGESWSNMRYRISPSPNINARSFGDEVIVANFFTGVYYSLLGSAAQIWDGLMAGVSVDRVVREVAGLSQGDLDAFAEAAARLVRDLEAERLIMPAAAATESAWTPVPPSSGAYALPALERFTDMQDLLLLDPVHEVEDMGWPHAEGVQQG
jgi:hypothetical protein